MGFGDENNSVYLYPGAAGAAGAAAQPLPYVGREQTCYSLDPNLERVHSGIHNGDHITRDSTEGFQRRVGRTDGELKFLAIQGGWDFPSVETQLLARQGRMIFTKYEAWYPPPPGLEWEDIKFNYGFMDRLIPKDYFNLLLELSNLVADTPADLETRYAATLKKYGITDLNPSTLAAQAHQIRAKMLPQELSRILKNARIDPSRQASIVAGLRQEVQKENAELLRQFSALLRANRIEPNSALLNQLVGKSKTDGKAGDLQDLIVQFYVILQQHRVDLPKPAREKLAKIALNEYPRLLSRVAAVLKDNGIARPGDKLVRQLGKKLRQEYDNTVLELDLYLRRQKVAQRFAGEYDNLIRQNLLKAKEAGVPIFRASSAEMNGYGGGRYFYPYGIDPVKTIIGQRHEYDLKRAVGAKNVLDIWNPHVVRRTEKDFTDYYPGHDYVDLIAFDVYCERDNPQCGALVDYLKNAIADMDRYLKERGLPPKRYGIGEWGASSYAQLDAMLTFLESNFGLIKFSFYYNVNEHGNYKMSPAMEKRYQKYLKNLAAYNARKKSDRKAPLCQLPQTPNPALVIRPISSPEFLSPDDLGQSVCLPPESDFTPGCLAPFPPGWNPDRNQPVRCLTFDQLKPVDQKHLDLGIGDVFYYGSYFHRLNVTKITNQLDLQELKLETLEKILKVVSSFPFAPFNSHADSPENFLADHPELVEISRFAPKFSPYLQDPNAFWENLILVYNIYVQKVIENSNEKALAEAVTMGEELRGKILAQSRFEKDNCAEQPFIPFKYRLAFFLNTLAEAYSQLRDAPVDQYQRGLIYTEQAVELFKHAGIISKPDYFSISKGIITAADLHSKIAQQLLREARFEPAKQEYEVAKRLYDSVSRIDYDAGTGLSLAPFPGSGISVEAGAQEMVQALMDNEKLFYLNHPEAIASAHGAFRFLRGLSLLKQAGFYIEFAFKPLDRAGYPDIIQNLVYVKSGLEEIAAGSPFADLRYFRAWGNMLIAKLVIQFTDSLSYSTSEMTEADARRTYLTAIEQLRKNLPELLSAEDWSRLEIILKTKNDSNLVMVRREMDNLKRVTKQPVPTPGGGTKIKDVASENYLKVSEALFKQTHTTYNYRITFMDWMVTLAQRYLEESKAELSAPNRFGIDDDMKSKTKILYAELLLLESSLEQRWSRYIYFINQSRTLDHNKIKSDPDMLGKLRDRIVEADKQLPESSYLKIELAFARATLELSIDTSQLGAAYRQRVYKTIDLLTANPPDLSADYPDPTYRVIKYLEALRPRIMAQPEPNRTILLNQLQTKLALAHIILAANLADSFPGKMNYCIEKIGRHGNSPEGRECKIFIKYSRKAAKIAQNILRDLESKTDARITQSGEPLMFDLHDFRAELYHQLSIAYAFLDDGPQMEHYLALAKEENIASNSRFNVYYRSWILNSFAIPKPMRSEQEMRFMIDVDNPVKGILFEQRAKRKD